MESIWTESTSYTPHDALHADLQTDAVVIGGGMAGILTAYLLGKSGIHTVVLEARRAGSGQTGSEQGESGRTADGGRAQDGGQGDAEDLYSLAAAGFYRRRSGKPLSPGGKRGYHPVQPV